jgi:RNA polymerase sigma-70 factor (ECF subfamily)
MSLSNKDLWRWQPAGGGSGDSVLRLPGLVPRQTAPWLGTTKLVNSLAHVASELVPMTAPSPAPDPPDASLVAAYRQGDERAAAELVRRHSAPLSRYLYGVGAPRGELEDLVQETFIKAFRALEGWRGEASFRSWLFRIGANLSKDWYRRDRGREVVSILDNDLPDSADPGAEAEATDAEERLRRGVGTLPRLQREVFLLRAQQGMEYDDIASSLGTTPGAARVHYHHAVKRLKEMIV